jgi:hypothetical protein
MIDLNDPTTWPEIRSVWRHEKSGDHYYVADYANIENNVEKRDRYPVTILYRKANTDRLYARRLDDWERSFSTMRKW